MNHMYGSPGANKRTGPDVARGGRGWLLLLVVAAVGVILILAACGPATTPAATTTAPAQAPATTPEPTCERDPLSALPDSYFCAGPAGPYTVRSINTKALTVVCASDTATPRARTRLWDPEMELKPTVGDVWLCNSRDTYRVRSVEPSEAGAVDGYVNVTCASTSYPGSTKTKLWDALVQPAPVVGDMWLCNRGDS